MKLRIFKETQARLPTSQIMQLFDLVIRREGGTRSQGQVNLIVCSDARIKNLNARFRGIERATDVLSFDLGSAGVDDPVTGEIYISARHARRQALRAGHGPFAEYLHLFCHGLLHLLGYDHDTIRRERTMFALQARYLDALRRRG